jgi:hypothetical protein
MQRHFLFATRKIEHLLIFLKKTFRKDFNFNYHILSSIVRIFYIENDAEIFPVHYTWKVAEKGVKMAFMMNKDAMINSCKIILEK